MSNAISLEIQKSELLTKIHSSRDEYRLLLNGQERIDSSAIYPALSATRPDVFPRSDAMRWAIAHPGWCIAGVVAVALIGPGRIARAGGTVLGTSKSLVSAVGGTASTVAPLLLKLIPAVLSYQRQRRDTTPV